MIATLQSLARLIDAHRTMGESKLRAFWRGFESDAAAVRALAKVPSSSLQSSDLVALLLREKWGATTPLSREFPPRLRLLSEDRLPASLYLQGNIGIFTQEGIGIIGTRRPTAAGRSAAADWAAALAKAGFTVVSGNAPGIDSAAHSHAVKAGGSTLIFPPVPPEQFQPSFSTTDADPLQLLIASCFAPGSKVEPWCFLRRNEFVAIHSRALIVAETGTRGGTLNTVQHARRFRRPLFSIDLGPRARHANAHKLLVSGGAIPLPPAPDNRSLNLVVQAAKKPVLSRRLSDSDDLFIKEVAEA